MKEKQAKIYNLLESLLMAAQDLVELEAGQLKTEQLASILYEKNRSCGHDDAIDFLKSLLSTYDSYKEFIQEIEDKYDAS